MPFPDGSLLLLLHALEHDFFSLKASGKALCLSGSLHVLFALAVVFVLCLQIVFLELRLGFTEFLFHLGMVGVVCTSADGAWQSLLKVFAQFACLLDLQEYKCLVQAGIAFVQTLGVALGQLVCCAALFILSCEPFDGGALHLNGIVACHDVLPYLSGREELYKAALMLGIAVVQACAVDLVDGFFVYLEVGAQGFEPFARSLELLFEPFMVQCHFAVSEAVGRKLLMHLLVHPRFGIEELELVVDGLELFEELLVHGQCLAFEVE